MPSNVFWGHSRSVATVSATKTKSNTQWSSGDQRDQTASEFFIQLPLENHQVREKSFQATEVSFMIV